MASRLLIFAGQSNCLGIDATGAPGGLPLASVGFQRNLIRPVDTDQLDTTPTTLRVTTEFATPSMGPECQCGLDLRAGGAWVSDTITVVKCSVGGSEIAQWLPTASQRYYAMIQNICLAARGLIGTDGFNAYFIWNQGENDANNAGQAAAWAANFTTIHSALQAWLDVDSLPRVIVRLRSGLGSQNATMRTQQASVADALIDRDDTTEVGDGIHDTGAAQNTIGSRIATALLAF